MSSQDSNKDDRKRDKKDKKKKKKKESKKRKTEDDAVAPSPAPVVPPASVVPAPDLSKMSAEEKRKLLAAGRGARKAAYVGTEIAGPQQAKFKKFLRLSAGADDQHYDPSAGTAATTPEAGAKLEKALTSQFNKSLDYQFGGGGGGAGGAGGKRRGLGSK